MSSQNFISVVQDVFQRSKGYRNLTGIDCCDAAVKLADAIARQGRESDQAGISFAVLSRWKRKNGKKEFSDSRRTVEFSFE